MSSEAPPQPVSDTFNYSQWNQSTSESATQVWATRRFLSKLFNDVAAGLISFAAGIKTNLITAYSGNTLTLGESALKTVGIYSPVSLSAILETLDNSSKIPSTSWVHLWFNNIVSSISLSWQQAQEFANIKTNQINGSNLDDAINLYSSNNQQGDLNILNFNYPTGAARPNVNIACGVSNDFAQNKSQVNILVGTSYGKFTLGGYNSTCNFTGHMFFNSGVINSNNGISMMIGNYIGAVSRPNLDIMTSTNIDELSAGGNVNIQNGTSNGTMNIGNIRSTYSNKAGTIKLGDTVNSEILIGTTATNTKNIFIGTRGASYVGLSNQLVLGGVNGLNATTTVLDGATINIKKPLTFGYTPNTPVILYTQLGYTESVGMGADYTITETLTTILSQSVMPVGVWLISAVVCVRSTVANIGVQLTLSVNGSAKLSTFQPPVSHSDTSMLISLPYVFTSEQSLTIGIKKTNSGGTLTAINTISAPTTLLTIIRIG